jgi:hypothetical protein
MGAESHETAWAYTKYTYPGVYFKDLDPNFLWELETVASLLLGNRD